MKNFRFFMAVALVTLIFVLAAIPQNHPPAATAPLSTQLSAAQQLSRQPSAAEQALFDATNRERAKEDLPSLKWDNLLASSARRHAALMARRGMISHQFSDEPALVQRITAAGARFSSLAENVAVGQDTSDIHFGWMHSPGHRANILGAKFTALGIAVVEAKGRLFAVQDFSLAVADLNLDEQEKMISSLLKESGIQLTNQTQDARKECANEGAPPGNRTMSIVRFEAPDLSKLPEGLERKIRSNAFRRAEVGACQPMKASDFPVFRIAVLLF
jgi:uncharacterized protein YkwD